MACKNLAESEYSAFRQFLEQQCGIVLGDNKQYLVKSRLAPLMDRFGVPSLSELVARTLKPTERQLRATVIDAMTTNETLWFRDNYPYDLLKSRIFPELRKQAGPVKVWSAASSSGQEPYSIAMTALEYLQSNPGAFRTAPSIVGTDISVSMLEMCKKAEYDKLALGRGLSEQRKRQFFESVDGNVMRVKENVRKLVSFRSLNLLDSYTLMGKFDIIFCRNVLIYFSPDVKKKILSQFANALNSKGYLMLGASESISGLSDDFDMIRCNPGIIYQKRT